MFFSKWAYLLSKTAQSNAPGKVLEAGHVPVSMQITLVICRFISFSYVSLRFLFLATFCHMKSVSNRFIPSQVKVTSWFSIDIYYITLIY